MKCRERKRWYRVNDLDTDVGVDTSVDVDTVLGQGGEDILTDGRTE